MPKYIVNNAQFNPIDFEDRIKPMAAYVDTFNKEMDALDEAGVLGDTIGELINPNDSRNSELLKTYNNYSTLLNDTVDSMLSSGNVSSARESLRALRRKYAKELVPIQQGYTNWQQAIKDYDSRVLKDDTFIGNDPRKYSISDYMNGKSPNNYSVSGNTLYTMGAKDAAAASARKIVQGDWKLDPQLLGEYFSRINITGWSQEDISDALTDIVLKQRGDLKEINKSDLNEVSGYIRNAYNRIAKASGIDNFDDDNNYLRAGNYILNGIMAGLSYDEKYEKVEDKNFLNPLERARLEGENLDNAYKRLRNSGLGNESQEENQQGEVTYGLTPMGEVLGKTSNQTEAINILSKILENRNAVNEPTGRKIEDPDFVRGEYDNNYTPRIEETNARRLYNISKELGYTGADIDYNTFLDTIKNASPETLIEMANTFQTDIVKNSTLYQEYYTNVTKEASGYVTRSINQNNSGLDIRQSSITNSNGKKIKVIPEEDSDGTYRLPISKEERNKGIKFVSLNINDKGKGNTYYIKPEAFTGASVTIPTTKGDMEFSLSEAMNAYYEALDAMDVELATYLGQEIISVISSYRSGAAKGQSGTDSKI